jgi:hypothetical protein
MTQWLAAHPDVFMPEVKVPCHFGSDLDMTPKRRFRDLDTYLSLFSGVTTQRRVGESTPFYLYSERAAQEIRAFDPAARIIIMLRNPVDMMYSMHARNLMDGNEEIEDFAMALEAERGRKAGTQLPRRCFFRQGLYYRDLAHFPEQVARYLDIFSPEQVHVVVFEDIKSSPRKTLNAALSFLGLKQSEQDLLKRSNESVGVRSPMLAGILRDPPTLLKRLPAGVGDSLVWRLNRWNRAGAAPAKMNQNLRRLLLDEFAGEVRELGQLLNRDLSHWLDQSSAMINSPH